MHRGLIRLLALAGHLLIVQRSGVAPAWAAPATCFTTDDGSYPCEFVVTDAAGSFEVSAPGYPSYALIINSPGVAAAFITLEPGERSIALPAPYLRSAADPACWENPETQA